RSFLFGASCATARCKSCSGRIRPYFVAVSACRFVRAFDRLSPRTESVCRPKIDFIKSKLIVVELGIKKKSEIEYKCLCV
uniref:Uncharacterized protein n=1 Tax=Anopheles atroparvus TaxID=41427 RepID=A0AAG5DWX5_ANOAO